ncbi:MAG TPA: helix-turn-helix domain-containing protein, partial [Acidobacteriota bacterium]|nr:helix-turn-helix domain-containing protein [Acidobacteriota bacterium]
VVLCSSEMITLDELFPQFRKKKPGKLIFGDGFLPLKEVERLYTEKVLQSTGGNIERTARILGISSRTLYRRNHKSPDSEASISEMEKKISESPV